MGSVYTINRGVSKPIVFKGLKAQYIAYLAIGLVLLLILFAILYICGVGLMLVLPLILGLGAGLFFMVFRLSHRFGEHGLKKYWARRSVPRTLKFRNRGLFIRLKGGARW
ncbi:hypothetical protein AQ505_08990 [Pedobacter sp. PACM 27299]|uniref:DUF4133 domain-containing protein n=1 Tax=Pedobacter sp. PACM 27299 TaxID=1727164 RepID=UPI000705E9CA|nr:DUF4133 domain-containing protein [Pedobacter sp. PACM 27299]ALL05616.1 hypothetical protein AQ505_08990 [Pedobacter sp. PACM 27299]